MKCEWKEIEIGCNYYEYETGCNYRLVLSNLKYYSFRYCPYCGKEMVVMEVVDE